MFDRVGKISEKPQREVASTPLCVRGLSQRRPLLGEYIYFLEHSLTVPLPNYLLKMNYFIAENGIQWQLMSNELCRV